MTIRCAAALIGLGLTLAAGQAAHANSVLIRIQGGWVRGVVTDGVASFKGIPFAAPPVGPLRWRAPQPPTPWRGVRDASAYGPECLQMSDDPRPSGERESEDCLTINVFAPAHRPASAKLPVMVWIYGGGFREGSANYADGTRFALQGVILVAFNYRLWAPWLFRPPRAGPHQSGGGALRLRLR